MDALALVAFDQEVVPAGTHEITGQEVGGHSHGRVSVNRSHPDFKGGEGVIHTSDRSFEKSGYLLVESPLEEGIFEHNSSRPLLYVSN